jgi:hypothetical protein
MGCELFWYESSNFGIVELGICPHPQPLCLDSLIRRETRRARIAPKLGRGELEPKDLAG